MTIIAHTHLSSTHSTNSQLIDWITLSYQEQSPPEHQRPHFSRPHLLTSDTQTSGRGQHGRTWQSPIGNVYLSLYIPFQKSLPPLGEGLVEGREIALSKNLDGRLSLCVGYQLSQMALIKTINQNRDRQNLPTVGVKWVNDVGFYAENQFQKLAGILIEPVTVNGKMLGVVIGVGVNIRFAPTLTTATQEGLNYQAICLQDLTQNTLNTHNFYQPIQTAIVQAAQQFNGFAKGENVQTFIHDFANVDVLLGKTLQITSSHDKSVTMGEALGIDSNGSLQIRQNDGTITPVWTGMISIL